MQLEQDVFDCHALAGTGQSWHEARRQVDYRIEQLLERAGEAGIRQACLMPPRSPSYEKSNQEIARICEKHPRQFVGFAAHNPQREAGRIRQQLRAEVTSTGMRGLRADGAPTRELLDAAAELRIPVMYYPGGGPARRYHMILSSYPTVNFILPHLGSYRTNEWWAHVESIDLCKRYPNVYLETSGLARLKYLEMAARELPAERILFGSYAPELDARVELFGVKLLELPPDRKALILGGNFRRLIKA